MHEVQVCVGITSENGLFGCRALVFVAMVFCCKAKGSNRSGTTVRFECRGTSRVQL